MAPAEAAKGLTRNAWRIAAAELPGGSHLKGAKCSEQQGVSMVLRLWK